MSVEAIGAGIGNDLVGKPIREIQRQPEVLLEPRVLQNAQQRASSVLALRCENY